MKTWLAVGDEAGNWDAVGSANRSDNRIIGASLTLAPLPAWEALHTETIGKRTAMECMENPVFNLPPEYNKSKHLHIKDTLPYFTQTRLTGLWSLSEHSEDPVKNELLSYLRWLAGHPRLITLGAYGSLSIVRQRLHYGEDAAQALGQLYAHLAALIIPFLGPDDHIQVSPGLRSENTTGNIALERTRITKRGPEADRLDGDTRGMFSACKDTALRLLNNGGWSSAGSADFAERLEVGTFDYLKTKTRWPYLPYQALHGTADLGASLMSMLHFSSYAIRLEPNAMPHGNARFFRLEDLIERAPR